MALFPDYSIQNGVIPITKKQNHPEWIDFSWFCPGNGWVKNDEYESDVLQQTSYAAELNPGFDCTCSATFQIDENSNGTRDICESDTADFDSDGDVDGKDHAIFLQQLENGTNSITVETFAHSFGK